MGLSQYTTYLADQLCGGSSRKLIAGWWYSILGLTVAITTMSFVIMSTRSFKEGFLSIWSAVMVCALAVGGTIIMRKFHNSMAVGFFMGAVVSMSQMFFLLFLTYIGYERDQAFINMPNKAESIMAFLALCQSVLLGSFAAILAAHRSEILDKPENSAMEMTGEAHGAPTVSYEAPGTMA
jgi:signal transduction histidine kinase